MVDAETRPQGHSPQVQCPKHLDRYVQEFAGRHNVREQDTLEQLGSLRSGMEGKRLTYKALIKDNGLQSGAKAVAKRL